jgi:hypothetical protein
LGQLVDFIACFQFLFVPFSANWFHVVAAVGGSEPDLI